ncbi:MAG: TonB-dependent receptor plug domain-containing protein [Saprospiraceae bacterium]|nr:TonB-dependent receptor plug domain-containing protein [Saprospiraceae bacterium]
MRQFLFSICFWFCCCFVYAQQNETISLSFDQTPLKAALIELENTYDLRFSYAEDLVRGKQVSVQVRNASLSEALHQLFDTHDIGFEVERSKYIILTAGKRVTPKKENIYCGNIIEKSTSEPLAFSVIRLLPSGKTAITEEDGSFRISGSSTNDKIEVSYIGFGKRTFPIKNNCATYALEAAEIQIEQVVLKHYLSDGIDRDESGRPVVLSPKRIGIVPGQPEADVMQSIQLLPGITSPQENASDIYIRGGSPDQNYITLDNIPLYHTGHFFGMISGINPHVTNSVSVQKNATNPKYGGRVSGVVEIKLDTAIVENGRYGFGANATQAHGFAVVPVSRLNSGFMVSGRRSYTDVWESPTFENLTKRVYQQRAAIDTGTNDSDNSGSGSGSDPDDDDDDLDDEVEDELDNDREQLVLGDPNNEFVFNEFNAKWVSQVATNHLVEVAGLYSNNESTYLVSARDSGDDYEATDDLFTENQGASLLWTGTWGDRFFSQVKGAWTRYDYNVQSDISIDEDDVLGEEQYTRNNRLSDLRAEVILGTSIADFHQLSGGYQFERPENFYDLVNMSEVDGNTIAQSENSSLNHIAFGNYEYAKGGVKLNGGIRANYFSALEEFRLEPRFSAYYKPARHFSLRVAGGFYSQMLSQLADLDASSIGFQKTLWIIADGINVPLQTSQHYDVGIMYETGGFVLDVEAYSKVTDGVTTSSNAFAVLPGQTFSVGSNEVQGIDVLLKQRINQFKFWGSYTLSESLYTDFSTLEDSNFPAFNDQKHAISLIGNFEQDQLTLSAGWHYATGLPYTEVNLINNSIVRNGINTNRLDDYHRLDVSALYRFATKNKNGWEGTIGGSVMNVYDRFNPLSREYFLDDADPSDLDLVVVEKNKLGRTPNLVLKFEF